MEETIKTNVISYIKTIGRLMQAEQQAAENNNLRRCRELEALNYAAQEELTEIVYRAAVWYGKQLQE
jgi:hypothetical protein